MFKSTLNFKLYNFFYINWFFISKCFSLMAGTISDKVSSIVDIIQQNKLFDEEQKKKLDEQNSIESEV